MILGQISYLDCMVFVIFLAPQLLFNVNIFLLLFCFLRALPFFWGDSAGATLILTLLLHIATKADFSNRKPGFATLISPWTTLFSSQNRNTASDFLDSNSLHMYGRQYAGSEERLHDPLISPGACKDGSLWAKASPSNGFGVIFGSEELLGPELRDLIALWRKSGCAVSMREEPGAIHAWPVATLFLSNTQAERQKGLKDLVKMIRQSIDIE
ncbi:hypothetical protein P7C71_g4596, partial [Lecanoromycetidae sp. Uapishka_2]